jgi:hypothetical protein
MATPSSLNVSEPQSPFSTLFISAQAAWFYRNRLLKLMSFSAHRADPLVQQILALDTDQPVRRDVDDVPIVDVDTRNGYWIDEC